MRASTKTRARQCLSTILFVFSGVSATAQTASLQGSDSLAEHPLDRACYVELSNPAANRLACQDALDDAVLDDTASGKVRQARLLAALAMLQAQREELPQARATMNRALALAATDSIVRGNQGNLLLREGAYQQALDTYNRLLLTLQETPAQPSQASLQAPLYLNRSLALRALGYYDEASKDVELYLTLIGALPPLDLEGADLGADGDPAARQP